LALAIPKAFLEAIIEHARREAPNECCGILAGREGRVLHLFPTTNAEHSPYRFNIEPRELLRVWQEIEARGWELLGIYHSHTFTGAYPSATDIELAHWPEAVYIIVSLADPQKPVLRAFHIRDGRVHPAEIRVEES